MYIPPAFAESNLPKLFEFIESHSFGLLVSQGAEPLATHLPFLLDRQTGANGRLIGHMARANPQWRQADNTYVLAIFPGPHAYISPTWYQAENVVPTWNYVAVHAYGVLRVVDDEGELLEILEQTIDFYEQTMPQPWKMSGAGEQLNRLVQMIVGFRIDIERIEGKWKLNQNHPVERRQRVIRQLADSADPGAQEVARLMQAALY